MRINSITFNNIGYIRPNNGLKKSFKGFDCDESSFEIKRVYNLPCPVCGVTMVQKNQIDNFVSKAKVLKGEELVSLLARHDKYFQEVPKKIAEILKIEALRSPDKGILELAQEYVSKNSSSIKYQQLEEIERLRKTITSMCKDKVADPLFNQYKDLIKKGEFSKSAFIREIKTIIPNSVMVDKKLERFLNKMPENDSEEYRYMARYSTESAAKLAFSLIEPSLSTCEHIVPKALGGKNNTSNYLAECNNDNSIKGDMPFSVWVGKKPSFPKNLQRYLDVIAEKIRSGEIPLEYVDYPLDIAKTIARETNGNITLDITKVEIPETNPDVKTETIPYQNRFTLSDYENKKKELEELIALQSRLITNGEYCTICEYTRLCEEKEKYSSLKKGFVDGITTLRAISDRYYKSINECEEIKEKLMQPNLSKTETKNLKSKLEKLEKFIESKNIDEIDEELSSKIQELQDIIPVADKIFQKLEFVKSKITFPSEIETSIAKLKADLFRSTQITTQISNIRKNIKERVKLESQVTQMESAVEGIAQENKMLNIASTSQDDIERYKNIDYIMGRSDSLEELCKKNLGEKFLQFDSLIFDFAREQAKKELEIMYKDNDYARYQRNLNKIEELTREIRGLQARIAMYVSEEKKLGDLNNQLNALRFQGDIRQELEEKEARLAELKEKFENVNINTKIEQCKKELEELRLKLESEQAQSN